MFIEMWYNYAISICFDMRKHIFKHRRIFGSLFLSLCIVGIFAYGEIAFAQTDAIGELGTDIASATLGALQRTISGLINLLLNGLLYLVVQLFSFCVEGLKFLLKLGSEMNNLPELVTGWRIVRNTMNSFFIVVLIAIAISTIIRFQQFNFRTTLPRLILAAFLVNFSRTICLLAINASNALMNTFGDVVAEALPILAIGLRLPAVAAFSDKSIGGLFGVDEALQQGGGTAGEIGLTVTLIFGLIIALVAVGAIAFFLVILLFRVVVLWFLTILSPLAFFLWGVPGRASSYWGQWLNEFVQHLIVGPVAAFFLYIILTLMIANVENNYGTLLDGNIPQGTSSLISQPQVLFGYLIGLGMMFVALEIIQQMGVRGGNFAERVGVDGIIKGGMRLAGYANDYLYSKGLSVKPGKAFEGIQAGIAARRTNWINDGNRILAKRVATSEEGGAGVRALLWATASGDQEFFEKNGLPQIAKRLAVGAGRTAYRTPGAVRGAAGTVRRAAGALTRPGAALGAAGAWSAEKWNSAMSAVAQGGSSALDAIRTVESLEQLQTMEEAIDNRSRARASSSIWSANDAARVSGFDKAGLDRVLGNIGKHEEYEQLVDRETDLKKDRQKAKNKIQWDTENAATLASVIGDRTALESDAERRQGELMKESKTAFEDARKLYSEQEDVYDEQGNVVGTRTIENGIGAQDTEIVGNIVARLRSGQAVSDDDKIRARILPELVSRLSKSEAALSAAKATFGSRISDIRTKMYPHGEEHDEVELANTARAHMNPQDKAEFAAPLVQAAEEGKFEAVAQMLDSKINLTNAGMKAFDRMLQQKLNMTEDEINELKMKVQAFAKKSGMYIQGALTKRTSTGRTVAASAADRAAVVEKIIRSKRGVYQAFSTGKLEAFTTKVNGKPQFDDKFWTAVKQNSGAINDLLKNKGGQLANVPPEILKALAKKLSDPKFSYLVDKSGLDNLRKYTGR